MVRLDDRPDRALVDEVADRRAREAPVDAEAVGEDRGGDHLVLGDLLDELVVGGLEEEFLREGVGFFPFF